MIHDLSDHDKEVQRESIVDSLPLRTSPPCGLTKNRLMPTCSSHPLSQKPIVISI